MKVSANKEWMREGWLAGCLANMGDSEKDLLEGKTALSGKKEWMREVHELWT